MFGKYCCRSLTAGWSLSSPDQIPSFSRFLCYTGDSKQTNLGVLTSEQESTREHSADFKSSEIIVIDNINLSFAL